MALNAQGGAGDEVWRKWGGGGTFYRQPKGGDVGLGPRGLVEGGV